MIKTNHLCFGGKLVHKRIIHASEFRQNDMMKTKQKERLETEWIHLRCYNMDSFGLDKIMNRLDWLSSVRFFIHFEKWKTTWKVTFALTFRSAGLSGTEWGRLSIEINYPKRCRIFLLFKSETIGKFDSIDYKMCSFFSSQTYYVQNY